MSIIGHVGVSAFFTTYTSIFLNSHNKYQRKDNSMKDVTKRDEYI